MTEVEIQLAYVEGQIAMAQSYVVYWVGMATSGVAAQRNRMGPMSDEAKTAEAMSTALRHVQRIQELTDFRDNLLRGRI